MRIGIVGFGVVGKAQENLFPSIECLINDPKSDSSCPLDLMVEQVDAIFVCVPTPRGDTRAISGVLKHLSAINGVDRIIVAIRSTLRPDYVQRLPKRYPHLRIVINPEFLVEAKALETSMHPPMLVCGGDERDARELEHIYREFSRIETDTHVKCSGVEASMIKIALNAFLSWKVTYANEMHKLCKRLGVEWDRIASAVQRDPRVGVGHMQVPGPDGLPGFGGKCLPKDLGHIIDCGDRLGVEMAISRAILAANEKTRSEDHDIEVTD